MEGEGSMNKANPSYNKESIQVFVRTVSGVTVTIDVEPNITVEMLKAKIQDKQEIPLEHQRLIYLSKQLENKRTLAEYNIQHGATIDLLLRLLG